MSGARNRPPCATATVPLGDRSAAQRVEHVDDRPEERLRRGPEPAAGLLGEGGEAVGPLDQPVAQEEDEHQEEELPQHGSSSWLSDSAPNGTVHVTFTKRRRRERGGAQQPLAETRPDG